MSPQGVLGFLIFESHMLGKCVDNTHLIYEQVPTGKSSVSWFVRVGHIHCAIFEIINKGALL